MKYFLCSQDVMHPEFSNLPLVRRGDIVGKVKIEMLRRDGIDCIAGYWCDSVVAVDDMRKRMSNSDRMNDGDDGFTHAEAITLHAALSAAVAALDPYL